MQTPENRPAESRDSNPYPPPHEMMDLLSVHPAKDEILAYIHKHGAKSAQILAFPEERRGSLTDAGIIRHLIAGNIIIEPFDHRLLQDNGYDVRLGDTFYFHDGDHRIRFDGQPTYNPFDPESIRLAWGNPFLADKFGDLKQSIRNKFGVTELSLPNINPEDLVIMLRQGVTALGHTEEFIGGRRVVSTRISGKSTVGRNMLEVCSDASLGDVNFVDRWTLEVTNKSPLSYIFMIVGEPVATITFEEVETPIQSYKGRYYDAKPIEQIKTEWRPGKMLPKWPRFERKVRDNQNDNRKTTE